MDFQQNLILQVEYHAGGYIHTRTRTRTRTRTQTHLFTYGFRNPILTLQELADCNM
jgi:hypothetical protein